MKRIASIFFISVYMLAFAEFHQLLKIPFLFEHYMNHRQADNSLGFISFLKLHYLGPIVIDDDYQQDQQLPFRDVDISLMATHVFRSELPVIEIAPLSDDPLEFHYFDEINKPQFTPFDIFQPPRRAQMT